nr:hypothetical protein [Tanacetum cinerariifolium]
MDFITKLPRSKSGHDTIWKALGTRLDMSTAYHPQTDGQSKRIIQIFEDMLRAFVIDFGGSWDVHLPSPVLWAKIRKSRLIGPKLVQEMTDKVVLIKEKLKAARDRQKRKKGPFEILKKIEHVAYRLRLLEELSSVHDTFHVLNLKKCLTDANLRVPLDEINIDKTLHFVEEPVEILDRYVKGLKRSKILNVKVHKNSKCGPEFMWEREDHMKANYPRLFVDCAVEPSS